MLSPHWGLLYTHCSYTLTVLHTCCWAFTVTLSLAHSLLYTCSHTRAAHSLLHTHSHLLTSVHSLLHILLYNCQTATLTHLSTQYYTSALTQLLHTHLHMLCTLAVTHSYFLAAAHLLLHTLSCTLLDSYSYTLMLCTVGVTHSFLSSSVTLTFIHSLLHILVTSLRPKKQKR